MTDELTEGLDDLEHRPIEAVRADRAAAQAIETGLSYLRRIVQGRLDIVTAELDRRAAGGDPADVSRLIEQLPAILADHLRAPGLGRLPSGLGQGEVDAELAARVDAVVSAVDDLTAVSAEQLAEARTHLADLEHEISVRRRTQFVRIDALQAELTRRYRAGEASVESLLR